MQSKPISYAFMSESALETSVMASIDKYIQPVRPRIDDFHELCIPDHLLSSPSRGKRAVRLHPGLAKRITSRQSQFQTPRVRYYPCRRVHQILNDLAKSAEFHLPTGNIPFVYRHLPAQPQHIERQYRKRQYQCIRRKLSAGKTLKRHIAFYFRMKLLAGSVIMIRRNHFLSACFLFAQTRPPRVYFDQRQQQCVAIPINRPFNHLEHNAHGLAIPLAHRIANVLYTVFPSRGEFH